MMRTLCITLGVVTLSGCMVDKGGGATARTPVEWQSLVGQQIDARSDALYACYAQAEAASPDQPPPPPPGPDARRPRRRGQSPTGEPVPPKESKLVVVRLFESVFVGESFVASQAPGRHGTPIDDALSRCVVGALSDIALPAGDKSRGVGTWWIVFDPAKLVTTKAPAAQEAP
ncbi:hypothetical protein [Chondromyces crocatus]|uniref:Lipoprotein n=1 Tax=Chondromyces crocatus TaxID=52 RepID=A0A0K1EKE5_CHOCO|nr:hypothetical protein [Chondromyces crocatus]AKT41340.1 uncharacterized protein CMC5_055390 [Chondromyces crocatus]